MIDGVRLDGSPYGHRQRARGWYEGWQTRWTHWKYVYPGIAWPQTTYETQVYLRKDRHLKTEENEVDTDIILIQIISHKHYYPKSGFHGTLNEEQVRDERRFQQYFPKCYQGYCCLLRILP